MSMKGDLEMETKILRALIIRDFVGQNYLTREQLSGVNNILESFSDETLKAICIDLQIDIEEG